MQFIWKKLINSLKKQQVNTLKKIENNIKNEDIKMQWFESCICQLYHALFILRMGTKITFIPERWFWKVIFIFQNDHFKIKINILKLFQKLKIIFWNNYFEIRW